MDVRLVIEKGATRTREIRLTGKQTVFGRQKGCGVRIPSSQVSRRHCLLSIQELGYVTIQDLDSVNGTLLNGQPVKGRKVVRPGDRVEIGPVRFAVQYQLTQAALDQLLQASGVNAGPSEELDVLPLADEEVVTAEADVLAAPAVLGDDDGMLAPLVAEAEDDDLAPMAIPDDDLAPLAPADDGDLAPLAEAEEDLPMAPEGWSLPEANDLRDILAQMEDDKPGKRRR